MRTLIAAALAAAIPSPALPAEEMLRLEPTSPWNIDYADDSCALKREFGQAPDGALLELRQFAPDEAFSVLVAMDKHDFHLRPPKVRFLPEAEPRTIDRAMHFEDKRGMKAVKWYDRFAPEAPAPQLTPTPESDKGSKAPETAVNALEVASTFGRTVVLMTGEMHKPMEAMRACLDELITHWGVDAAAHRTLSQHAEPDAQLVWAREIQKYYPSEMLRQGKGAEVSVRMMVDAKGTPTECHIQIKSQDPMFEQTACEQMMRAARFKPALDAAGRPIASFWTTRIVYRIN